MVPEAAVLGVAAGSFASLVSAASLAGGLALSPEPVADAALCAVGVGGSGGIVGR